MEFAIIGAGFSFLLIASMTIYYQLAILTGILAVYIGVGLFHHKTHHDIAMKVVLEYILVSALVFALFVFLNVSRL